MTDLVNNPQIAPVARKRNHYISYLKGWAILSIIMVHLIDWSNKVLTTNQSALREIFYPGVLFFIALVGSVVFVAYKNRDWKQYSPRLVSRAAQIVGVYFAYNIIKLYIFNFKTEPFYWQFSEKGIFDIKNLLTLQAFSVPLTILLVIAAYLVISPLILLIYQKTKHPKLYLGFLLAVVLYINYLSPIPQWPALGWLFGQGTVMFSFMYWLPPYLLGFYLAMLGLEEQKEKMLWLFSGLTAFFFALTVARNAEAWRLSWNMYPLRLYYLAFCFAFFYWLMYLFQYLENVGSSVAKYVLSILRVLGDGSLLVYVGHWLVIDATIWYFSPDIKLIWYTVPAFLVLFLIWKRKELVVK